MQTRIFLLAFRGYQILHIVFNICWSLRMFSNSFLWWAWWGIAFVFLVWLLLDKQLETSVNSVKSTGGKVLAVLWIVSNGISGFAHSPRI